MQATPSPFLIAPRRVVTVAALVLAAAVGAGPAMAHTEISSSSPGRGRPLRPRSPAYGSRSRDTSAGGPSRSSGRARRSSPSGPAAGTRETRSALLVGLKSQTQSPASYKVIWRIIAGDGHFQAGTFTFKLVQAMRSPARREDRAHLGSPEAPGSLRGHWSAGGRPRLPSRRARRPRPAADRPDLRSRRSTGTTPTPTSSPRGSPRRPGRRQACHQGRTGGMGAHPRRLRGGGVRAALQPWAARSSTFGPSSPPITGAVRLRDVDARRRVRQRRIDHRRDDDRTRRDRHDRRRLEATGAVPGAILARPFVLTYDGIDGVEPHWVDRAPGGVTPDGIEFGADYVVGGLSGSGGGAGSVSPGPDHGVALRSPGPPRRRRRCAPQRAGSSPPRAGVVVTLRMTARKADRPAGDHPRRTARSSRGCRSRRPPGFGPTPGPRIANPHDQRLLGVRIVRSAAPRRHGTGRRADPARAAGTGPLARGDVGDAVWPSRPPGAGRSRSGCGNPRRGRFQAVFIPPPLAPSADVQHRRHPVTLRTPRPARACPASGRPPAVGCSRARCTAIARFPCEWTTDLIPASLSSLGTGPEGRERSVSGGI